MRDHHEAPLGLVTVTRDITERLALERHLMHDERMAVVGKIAAAVAHEINNPIGVVSLYAQHALAKLPPGSPIQKHLETIRRNAESCRKITGDLLELARPRTPEHERVDLRLLCKDVAQSVEALAATYGVQVADESRSNAAPLWAEGDAGQLRQALLNLALNAVEALSGGGSCLDSRVRDPRPGRDRPRGRGQRHRERHPAGSARADLPALLHHETLGNRPRPRRR